ncbi:hypothetical protein OG223_39100 [Streptomyces sp. NBC_01478]|uniref:hypothetical protein n=1 Tax=Streptomyces sp. NBC_01478 TaxID=2903882 RepID=UPI002E366A59|nr:hypothetical protein [Streptomyces sp. NBC_01478]
MLAYLPGFAPWIVAGVLSSFDWRWGAIGGLVTGLLMMLNDRRRGIGFDALVLEISTLAYFVVLGAVSVARPDSSLADRTDVISFVWLAATAWGSLVVWSPFTLGIAKRQTPREYWDTPGFLQVNNYITSAWGAGFTFIAVSLAVANAVDAPVWVGITAHVVGLVAPAIFTKVYPARVQARLMALAQAQPQVRAVP